MIRLKVLLYTALFASQTLSFNLIASSIVHKTSSSSSIEKIDPDNAESEKEEREKTTHTPLPSEVRLIIYSEASPKIQELCLVKDIRKVSLSEGLNQLILQEIPQKFLEDSLLIRSLDDLPLTFTEFSFHSDLLTFENLLEKSVGEEILVLSTSLSQSKETQILAHLLGIEKGKALVQIGSRIETVPLDRIAFHSIPPSLSLYPLLHVNVTSPKTQDSHLELTYMTKGLSWKANYTAEIDPQKNHANMMGWVAIKNTSGVHFRKAHIQLASAQQTRTLSSTALPFLSQLYPLPLPTSLYHDTTKKVAFLSASKIKVTREYRIELPLITQAARESYTPLETRVWFAIPNSPKNKLGFLLPAGEVKIYAQGLKETRYVGTISMKHTNVSEAILIPVETCQLVEAQIQQVDFKQLGASITEAAFRVTVTNKNSEPLRITLMQKLPSDTKLIRNSLEGKQEIADDTVLWPIEIPSNETISLRYRVRTVREKEIQKTEPTEKTSIQSTPDA